MLHYARMGKLYSEIPQVAVMVPSAIKTCRELRDGILRYVRVNGPWAIHLFEGRGGEQKQLDFQGRRFRGVIGHVNEPPFSRHLPAGDYPIVLCDPGNTNSSYGQPPRFDSPERVVCVVDCDNEPIGVMAAEHFLEQNAFRSHAFVGEINDVLWSQERRDAYRKRLAEAGHDCQVYPVTTPRQRGNAKRDRRQLVDWLKRLESPCAVFAAFDIRARQVLDACLEAGLSVPHEIAILSVDDDPAICETSIPQLSSIRMNSEAVGYRAAEILDRAMRGELPRRSNPERLDYGFAEIIVRASSVTTRLRDPLVERALASIRLNAVRAFGVADLAAGLSVSRRLLELHFRQVLGRTVHDEIMLARLMRMKTLLRDSQDSIENLASLGGFANASHFITCFKRQFGITPSQFRRRPLA